MLMTKYLMLTFIIFLFTERLNKTPFKFTLNFLIYYLDYFGNTMNFLFNDLIHYFRKA